MNAISFNHSEWLCVLQLIHDDDSFPREQLSCWDEKNGVNFAFAAFLSFRHLKKQWTCFKYQDLSIKPARLFIKKKKQLQKLFFMLQGNGICHDFFFPSGVYPNNWVDCRNERFLKNYRFGLHCMNQVFTRRCMWIILLHSPSICGYFDCPGLRDLQHSECKREMEH